MLKDYLLDVMQQHEHGLYMCELPTGNGKTYDSARAMKEYADSIGDDTKIIYLTTLNKNLPEDALRVAYGSEELYKRSVLRLRSNFDEVVEKILEIEVPEEMKTDAYLKLCKDVSLYRNAVEKRYADKEYIKELAGRITEGDRQLRYEITKRLKNRFQTKTQRKNAIRTDAKYKWIGKLYPAVFTDDYKIILMSVSKFMKRNSILIDSSYEFLNSDLIENAVIVIDEFDATKDTIQSELIDKSLAMQEDYIQLFRQIYRTLNPNDFSSSMRQAMDEVEKSGNRNTFTTLMDEARKIAEDYHVRLSIKTKEDLVDQRQIFLFNDGSFHTVLKEGAQYIRSSLNKEDNRIDVFFEGKDDFFKNRNKEKDIVLYSLLREINVFLLHFRLFSIEWARNYMEIINSSRSGIMDTMNLENAISTILKRLELTNKQRDLLMGETCQMIRNNRELILEDRSFYQVGMEYYEFEDNDSHHDNTNLKFVKVYDTPEKIMLYLAGKATVFGISATAEVDTVVGNYDLRYLKEQLKERFHKTPGYLKDKTRTALEKRWSAYADGEINTKGSSPDIKKIVQELIIKGDVRECMISIFDWERLDSEKDWTFVFRKKIKTKYGENAAHINHVNKKALNYFQYYRLKIDCNGEMEFDTFCDSNQDEAEEWNKICYAYDFVEDKHRGAQNQVEGLMYSDIDNIHAILLTREKTLPNISALMNTLMETDAKERVSKELLLEAIDDFEKDNIDSRECISEWKSKVAAETEMITKKALKKILNMRTGIASKFNRFLHEKYGVWIDGELRKGEFEATYQIGNLLNIKYEYNEKDYLDGRTFVYYVGAKSKRLAYPNACCMRKVISLGEELEYEEALPLMAVEFVRNSQYTVLPFPFKYLREYIKQC